MLNNPSKHLLILLLVSLIMLIANLGVIPVNIMEARNFITAREMVQDDNWILTTLNGMPRYEKPPLPTWMTAVLGMFFGFNSNGVLRIAVVFVTVLLVLYIYRFSLKLGLSGRTSFNNGLILITSFYIYFAGRDNQWDIYCHSFMIISIYYLWNILRIRERPIKNAVIGGIFLAFSILSKGPIALYALLLPFLISYGFIYRFKLIKEKRHLVALLVYIVIGLVVGTSWSTYIHIVDPEPLARMAKIETSRWVNDYNSKSLFYYWNFFTQSGIWTVPAFLGLIYPYMKSRVSNIKAYKFTLLWTLLSLVLLSIIPEKKVRYLLPTLIPLALNTGFYIEYIISGVKNKTDKILAIISFGLIGLVGILYPFILFFIFKDRVSNQINWAWISSITLFIAGITILCYLKKGNLKAGFYSLILLQCVVVIFTFPLAKSFLYNPNYKSAKTLHRAIKNNMDLYSYKTIPPEIIWEYGQKIPMLTEEELEIKLKKLRGGRIALLCTHYETESLISQLEKDYEVRRVSYVDLNTVSPENKDYRDRLVENLLIVYKKD